MATVQRTVSPMFGRILKQIRRAWGRWQCGRGMLKELHLHSENPFGNKIWIPPLIFWLYHTWSLLWRVCGIISHTRCVFDIVGIIYKTIGSSSYWGLFLDDELLSRACCPQQHRVQMSKQWNFLQTLYFLLLFALDWACCHCHRSVICPLLAHRWGNECLSRCPGYWKWGRSKMNTPCGKSRFNETLMKENWSQPETDHSHRSQTFRNTTSITERVNSVTTLNEYR